MEKKKWKKPELIVIIRSYPEENVLSGCKGRARNGPGRRGCTRVGCNAVTTS
jgi:hypothetical protein